MRFMAFAELCNTSNFTFLTGAAHAEEFAAVAFEMGMPALAIADENSVAGIVRAHVELREIARKDREVAEEENRPAPPSPACCPPHGW